MGDGIGGVTLESFLRVFSILFLLIAVAGILETRRIGTWRFLFRRHSKYNSTLSSKINSPIKSGTHFRFHLESSGDTI